MLVAPSAPRTAAPAPDPLRVFGWEEGRAAAERGRRPLFVFVRADWSARSVEIRRSGLFDDPSVRRALARFVVIDLDVTDEDAAAAVTAVPFDVPGVPSMFLWEPATGRRRVVAEPLGADQVRDASAWFLSGQGE